MDVLQLFDMATWVSLEKIWFKLWAKMREEKSFYKPKCSCSLSESMGEFSHCTATCVAVIANFLYPSTWWGKIFKFRRHVSFAISSMLQNSNSPESRGTRDPCKKPLKAPSHTWSLLKQARKGKFCFNRTGMWIKYYRRWKWYDRQVSYALKFSIKYGIVRKSKNMTLLLTPGDRGM